MMAVFWRFNILAILAGIVSVIYSGFRLFGSLSAVILEYNNGSAAAGLG
jgi:hypothetical protein